MSNGPVSSVYSFPCNKLKGKSFERTQATQEQRRDLDHHFCGQLTRLASVFIAKRRRVNPDIMHV